MVFRHCLSRHLSTFGRNGGSSRVSTPFVNAGKNGSAHLMLLLVWFCHSVVSDSFETRWTVAHRAPLSMGFPRQERWSGLPFPSPGDLFDPGIKPVSPVLTGGILYCWVTREAKNISYPILRKTPITVEPEASPFYGVNFRGLLKTSLYSYQQDGVPGSSVLIYPKETLMGLPWWLRG